jgi:hypothetical protein
MEIKQICRGGGKTTLVLERMKLNPKAVMIVISYRERNRIENENEWIKGRVFAFEQFVNQKEIFIGSDSEEAYIDNIDLCLNFHCRIPTTLMTSDVKESIK